MKLDKETLVKHQFWLLLGLSGTFALVALVLLFFGPASKVQAKRKEFLTAKESLSTKAPKNLKNGQFLPAWEERKQYFAGHKNTVWKEAWETQSDLMTWPSDLRGLEKQSFGDTISNRDLLKYKETSYDEQFKSFEAFVAPRPGEEVYFPVSFDPKTVYGKHTWKTTPTIEEAWLAQEDIWVRREIVNILRSALETVGRFKQIRGEPLWRGSVPAAGGLGLDGLLRRDSRIKFFKDREAPKGFARSLLFENHNWRVELLLETHAEYRNRLQISARSTIENKNPSRRPLSLTNGNPARGLRLRIRQGSDKALVPRIEGVLLRYGDKAEFKQAFGPTGIDFRKDFELEEVFDSATSPIKLLEKLEIGSKALSHLLAVTTEMVTGRLGPKPKATTQTPGQGQGYGGNPSMNQGGGSMQQPPPQGGQQQPNDPRGRGQGLASSKNVTPNGIVRVRYALSNKQVRRIPIAFTIVVDQAYRNEVLAAVANSRLRIQTTQVYWAHRNYTVPKGVVPGIVPSYQDQPIQVRPGGSGGRTVSPPPPGRGKPPMVQPMQPPILNPMQPPIVNPMKNEGSGEAGDTEATTNRNLIELSVHGIAALFERFKPPSTKGTPNTNQGNGPSRRP